MLGARTGRLLKIPIASVSISNFGGFLQLIVLAHGIGSLKIYGYTNQAETNMVSMLNE